MNEREMTRYFEAISKVRYKCKCGHVVTIYNRMHHNICSHCRRLVFKNKRDEFIYRLGEALRKVNKSYEKEQILI
jgi:hypothetical protein